MHQIKTFYWYDYETFGTRPACDWPAEFAGIRTDNNLNVIGEPLHLFCRLPNDQLPQPEACFITGITPQKVNRKGICEADFIKKINKEFSQPHTCVVGYNNLKFDDEVTRYSLYRNFLDPYKREWDYGNSRWDLIDVVRLCASLRPDSLIWPYHDNGKISIKLEDLTKTNNIQHTHAHTALSDVYATIDLAKLIYEKQPQLFNYVLQNKDKISIMKKLDLQKKKPVLYISPFFSEDTFFLRTIIPIAFHPMYKNEMIVYDLSSDPTDWINLSCEELHSMLFLESTTNQRDKKPIYTIKINQCPILVPYSVLRDNDKKRLKINQSVYEKNYAKIIKDKQFIEKTSHVFSNKKYKEENDPDKMLYSGGFFDNEDKKKIALISEMSPEDLGKNTWLFNDHRLPEMLFRYRCRNWPEAMSDDEQLRWKKHCYQRFFEQKNNEESLMNIMKKKLIILQNGDNKEKKQDILEQLLEDIDRKEKYCQYNT